MSSKTMNIKPGDITMTYTDLVYNQPDVGGGVTMNVLRRDRHFYTIEYISPVLSGMTNGAISANNRWNGILYNPSPEADYVIICIPRQSYINRRWNFSEDKFFKVTKTEAANLGGTGLLRFTSTRDNLEQFSIANVNIVIDRREYTNTYRLVDKSADAAIFNSLVNSPAYQTNGSIRFTPINGSSTSHTVELSQERYIHILVTINEPSGPVNYKFIFDADTVVFTNKYDIVDTKQKRSITKDTDAIAIKVKGSPLTENSKYRILEVIQKNSLNSEEDILIVKDLESKVMKTHTVKAKLLRYAED